MNSSSRGILQAGEPDPPDLSGTSSEESSEDLSDDSCTSTSSNSSSHCSCSSEERRRKKKKKRERKEKKKEKQNDCQNGDQGNDNQDANNQQNSGQNAEGNGVKVNKIKKGRDKGIINRSKTQRECEKLRAEIELKNLRNHMTYIDKELKLKRKRELLKIEDEIEHYDLHMKRKKMNNHVDLLNAKISLKEKEQEWKNWVDRDPEYHRCPMRKGADGENELVLSDRIIELSGVITYATSEYITDRIHYYNNQHDKHPIFLVIDYSPGGSVMAGYRILKSMESSPAPVYVIVKSFAASMAATICTMAEYSYVYPDAIILHHQISSRSGGNLVQHREQLAELEEWWKRLAGPITRKLKIKTLQDWIDLMYQHNSDGDWMEFGDNAARLGWATGVVHRLRETGRIKNPDAKNKFGHFFFLRKDEIKQEEEQRVLPKLRPMDCYWIYNPDNRYTVA